MKSPLITLSVVLLFICINTRAQDVKYQEPDQRSNPADTTRNLPGNVEIIRDSRIDSIVKMHIEYNKSLDGIMGYRVQIFFDAGNNSLARAEAESQQFQTLYPNDPAYISFTEPYYKVRVGDFRTKLEAEGYIQKIVKDFPNAFVIQDIINLPDLN